MFDWLDIGRISNARRKNGPQTCTSLTFLQTVLLNNMGIQRELHVKCLHLEHGK
jgi:hypothetical protein